MGHGFDKAVRQIDQNLAPYTTVTVHLVVRGEHEINVLKAVETLNLEHTAVVVTPLEEIEKNFYEGNWKSTSQEKLLTEITLVGMQAFAQSQGYVYFLHLHPDFEFREPLKMNIISAFDGKVDAGVLWSAATAPPAAIWGLPELLRFFLVAESMQPAGKLFGSCKPGDIEGLYTPIEPAASLKPEHLAIAKAMGVNATADGGWRPPCPRGNFVVVNLDFWLSPLVLRFLNLCRSSSGARLRWSEQGVHIAVLQALVPAARLHTFSFASSHDNSC